MSHVIKSKTEKHNDVTHYIAATRTDLDPLDSAKAAAEYFGTWLPDNVSVRSLQAAVTTEPYNIEEFPSVAEQVEEIKYNARDVTYQEAKNSFESDSDLPFDLDGKITSDDDIDVNRPGSGMTKTSPLFRIHTWIVPHETPEIR